MYWELRLVTLPVTLAEANGATHDVAMTSEGLEKLRARGEDKDVEWEPGVDYRINEAGGED